MSGLEAYAKEAETTEDLRRQLREALRRLERTKNTKADVLQAVREAIRDGISAIEIPNVAPPRPDKRKGDPETAVALVSDLQLGKVTPTYNSEVCRRRMRLYAEKVAMLASIQRADHPVKKLHVRLLGDIVEGELIFPGQSHLIDSSLYKQVTVDGPEILSTFLRAMLAEFEAVHVVGVIGNHGQLGGRAHRDYRPTSNADRFLYNIVRGLLRDEKRLTWDIPDTEGERNWYAVDRIGKTATLLCHGDQFRWGIKTPSCEQKILGWANGAIPEKFDAVQCGHWHQANLLQLRGGALTLRCNGSTESYNTYAQEHVGSMGRPCQWLLFQHDKQGETAEYRVWLD